MMVQAATLSIVLSDSPLNDHLSEVPLSPLLECNDSFASFVFVAEREDKKFNINIFLLQTFNSIGTKTSGFSNKRVTSLLSASLGESSERKTNSCNEMLALKC